MPGEIEDQIAEIIGAERGPEPTLLHYVVWSIFGLLALLFVILLAFVLFVALRTALLYGLSSLLESV